MLMKQSIVAGLLATYALAGGKYNFELDAV